MATAYFSVDIEDLGQKSGRFLVNGNSSHSARYRLPRVPPPAKGLNRRLRRHLCANPTWIRAFAHLLRKAMILSGFGSANGGRTRIFHLLVFSISY